MVASDGARSYFQAFINMTFLFDIFRFKSLY